ncbi:MAG TPA: CoA ester lyase [Streptosporangiaceae bacterium]|jgi:citrate lyase subunit beta/citryl-CoA lyase
MSDPKPDHEAVIGGPLTARSLFFVPGHRPDMIAKVPRWSPDIAVIDLEDAVAQADKDRARQLAAEALPDLASAAGPTTMITVRVNAPGSPWFGADLAAAAGSPATGVVVPKLESSAQAAQVRELLRQHGRDDMAVIAGLETVLGVADARAVLAAAGVAAAYFGAEDYIADIGGLRTAASQEVLYARSQVVMAARLAGVTAIDQAVVAVRDDEQFIADAQVGRTLGYQGKICVHPVQVELAHRAFTPSEHEVVHARAVLSAAAAGVALVDGEMVDEVHAKLAEAVLRRAGEQIGST